MIEYSATASRKTVVESSALVGQSPATVPASVVANGATPPSGLEAATDESKRTKRRRLPNHQIKDSSSPILMITKPLPRVLIIHCGGTLGMDPEASYETDNEGVHLKAGTGGSYRGLRPGDMLDNLFRSGQRSG